MFIQLKKDNLLGSARRLTGSGERFARGDGVYSA
jgi:hypothetical protein